MSVREHPPVSVITETELERYQTLYDDIIGQGGLIEYADRHALGELAVTMVEMQTLREQLREEGEYLKVQGDRNEITKKNPARDALEKIRPAYLRLMKEFRITPNSRGTQRVGGGGANKSDDQEFDDI